MNTRNVEALTRELQHTFALLERHDCPPAQHVGAVALILGAHGIVDARALGPADCHQIHAVGEQPDAVRRILQEIAAGRV